MTLHFTSGTSTAANASAYQVTEAEWASGTIQWSNKPAADVLLQSNISHNNVTGYVFSCLTAVQHWYDGDTTGQNENYGIMLCYQDPEIADYNSFYSADCTDATMRPALTISYTPANNEISVLEGYTKQLTVPVTIGTITWTSSNTAVATVNSAGKVTGIKAGKSTIMASVDGTEIQRYTVYVKIADGVYRIDSRDTNFYLAANSGALENATTLLRSETTEELPMLRQLWRVIYLSGGYYVIRPMHNQNMALHAKNGVSDVTTIGYDNTLSGVPVENRWTIEYLEDGYVFKCRGDSTQALRGNDTSPYTQVFTGEYNSTSQYFRWYFEDAPWISPRVLLFDTQTGELAINEVRTILPRQSATLDDFGLMATFTGTFIPDPDVRWSVSASSWGIVDSTTGTVTAGKDCKSARITAKIIYNNSDYSRSYTGTIVPFTNGTYYIENFAAQRYVEVANNSAVSGADMQLWSYRGSENQRWIFNLQDDGYFSIISARSGLALSVPSGQTDAADVTLVQETYVGFDRQKWSITTAGEYHYKIKAKSAEGLSNDLAIVIESGAPNVIDGLAIQQRVFTEDDSKVDEWLFCANIVDVGISSDDYTGGCKDGGRSSARYAGVFQSNLLGPTGGMFSITHHSNTLFAQTASPEDFAEDGAMSKTTDFMIYIGHGHTAHDGNGNHLHYDCKRIATPHTEGYAYCDPAGNVYSNSIYFGSDTSDLRWVWLYTCNFLNTIDDTGNDDDNPNNDYNYYVSQFDLVEMMNGAHVVMGYASRATLCDAMAEDFAEYLRNGMPIVDAYFKAGNTGEKSVETKNHYQRVLYIPQARYETIYSPAVRYECDESDVLIRTRNIQDEYSYS